MSDGMAFHKRGLVPAHLLDSRCNELGRGHRNRSLFPAENNCASFLQTARVGAGSVGTAAGLGIGCAHFEVCQ